MTEEIEDADFTEVGEEQEVEVPKIVMIDGNPYDYAKLPEMAQYCLMQMNEIKQESDEVKRKLDRLTMSNAGFAKRLSEVLEEYNAEDKEETPDVEEENAG